MSYLRYFKVVSYAYDPAQEVIKILKEQAYKALLKLIEDFDDVDASFSTQENTTYMKIHHEYYDLINKRILLVDKFDKIGMSMIEGHIRHLFKSSKVRHIYLPDELEFMIPYLRRQDYFKYFTVHRNFKYFCYKSLNRKFQVINKMIDYIKIQAKHLVFNEIKSYVLYQKYQDYLSSLRERARIDKLNKCAIKIQKLVRSFLTKRRLIRQIGMNMYRLRERQERNLRVVSSEGEFVKDSVIFRFSPVREISIGKFEVDQTMINRDKLLTYWVHFIENKRVTFDGSLEDRVYRTIINHAKWNAAILHWDLSYSMHSSSFCLFYHKTPNLLIEIDGQIYRSIGRRKIANIYEGFGIPNSKFPVQPHGSLYNTIARGIHSHCTYNLIHRVIDRSVLSENQKLFWVKYGNKKKVREKPIIIKNVHWVRKGILYNHKVSANRFAINKDKRGLDNEPETFQITEMGINKHGSLIDHEYNYWIRQLYTMDDSELIHSLRVL